MTLHSHTFSGILVLHYQVFILFSLIPTLFIDSYHSSFLFNGTDIIHLISSLLTLITSLYLLSFSINLDSILCSMYYDLIISYPYLSLITPLSFYSLSFYAYSFHRFSFLYSSSYSTSHFHSFSSQHTLSSPFFHSIPVLFFNPYRLICHSILPHYSTPFSFILSSFFPFIPFHIILSLPFYSHSILHPIPFQRHSPFLFFLSLLQATIGFDSLLLFYSPLCSQTPFYSHSTPLTASPHPSLYHYPLPYSFTQHLFCSFSSL